MTYRDAIQAGTRAAIALLAAGETWQFRRLTSTLEADPRTYDPAPTTFVARRASKVIEEASYDDRTRGFAYREVIKLTIADDTVLLAGDLVTDTVLVWDVVGQPIGGVGIRTVQIERLLPLVATADRGGAP